jgi:putative membrane protein
MVPNALMAFLHHLAAFTLVASLAYEHIAFRTDLTLTDARRIQRADLIYGISAGVILIAGLLRVFFFEKGVNYYTHNLFFWTKMASFVLLGLLSIYPTLRFLSWAKVLAGNQIPEITQKELSQIKLLLRVELALVVLILFSAAMMARGVGMI